MERVATDRQRIVDPDRLAGDLLPVLVDGQVRGEVGRLAGLETGRLEVQVLDQQEAGRADRLHRQGGPLRDDQTQFITEPRGHRGREQEEHQAGVGEQGGHPGVLVAVAIQEAGSIRSGRLAHSEAVATQGGPHPIGRHAGHGRPVREARIEERLRLVDPDLPDTAPQLRRAVQGADHDGYDQDGQPDAEPWRAEDGEDTQPFHHVDGAGTQQGVVASVKALQLGGVVGGGTEREIGHLADGHADHREE